MIFASAAAALLLIAYFAPSAYRKAQMDKEVDRLCALDGGAKIYEQVTPSPEILDQLGNLNIPFKSAGNADKAAYIAEDHSTKSSTGSVIDTNALTLHRFHYRIVRRDGEKILGESVSYSRSGGDPVGPWHPSYYRGPCTEEANRLENLIFKKDNK